MKTEILATNIKCSGCANTITQGISKLSGVKNVSVDIGKNIVTIEHDEQINKNDFTKTLTKLGYPEKTNN